MGTHHKRIRAFTLVELLIVVIILSILAAIVVPQFTEAATDTRLGALQSNLAIIRQQIEIYKLEHGGLYPELNHFAQQMTAGTLINGKAGTDFGPYLQRIPVNPFTVGLQKGVSNKAPAKSRAWYYDEVTGEFRPNDGGSTHGLAHSSL